MLGIAPISLCAALVLAAAAASAQSVGAAAQAPSPAQTPAQPPAATPPATPAQPPATPPATPPDAAAAQPDAVVPQAWRVFLDFGVLGTHVNGDAARYERYRDLGSGLFLEHAQADRDAGGWLLGFRGEHVGRSDQRLLATAVDPGKYRAHFLWDQIPMLLSTTTRTLYSGIGTGTLSIDDVFQAAVQAQPAALTPIFDQFSVEFDTKTRRHIGEGAFEDFATDALMFRTDFRKTNREGTIPFGGSFGHSSVVELPAPTRQDLNEFDVGAEYKRDPVLLRAGYHGSWFHQDFTSVTFDNPYRATDIPATSSRGRLTLPPSNSFVGVNGMASVKMPYKSRATAYVSFGMLDDARDPIIPQTINTSFVTAPIDRATVNGEARTSSVNLRFTSRPTRHADLVVSYRSYDYDNRTPEFSMTERVSYDNTPAVVNPPIHTEAYGVDRSAFDADFRWLANGRTSAGIGYSRIGESRSHRIFDSTTDEAVRVTFDSVSQRWFSVRTKYEHSRRTGTGIDKGEEMLASIGEQPGMRHFDIATRSRDRFTVIGSVTPAGVVAANLSFATGVDDFDESEFGVRDNSHRVYAAGIDYLPADRVTLAASYSYESYSALQRSRQANPGEQFNDPSRNWAADTADHAHSFMVNADIDRIAERATLRLAYDFSRTRGHYDYITGPVPDRTLPEEVIVPTTLPPPTQLPPTFSELQRATVDLIYSISSRMSLGVSYWYEQYRVEDFTLDIDANPELVRGQALLMGYLYRPYSANTWWGRLLYRW